jgi:hypothetical protein
VGGQVLRTAQLNHNHLSQDRACVWDVRGHDACMYVA